MSPTFVSRISLSSLMLSFRRLEVCSRAAMWPWQADSARKVSRTGTGMLMACLD